MSVSLQYNQTPPSSQGTYQIPYANMDSNQQTSIGDAIKIYLWIKTRHPPMKFI